MSKTPFLIIVILIIITLFACYFVWISNELITKDRITSLISIFACSGALISATLVIFSYIHTNFAFILSQKPHLLVQVTTQKVVEGNTNNMFPLTVVHYVNTTSNPFMDLSFDIKVTAGNRTVDLSDLFTKKMFMAAHDSRDRRFNTLEELGKRGLDINNEVRTGHQVVLKIIYSHTFNQKMEYIKIQEYFWNCNIQQWEIV